MQFALCRSDIDDCDLRLEGVETEREVPKAKAKVKTQSSAQTEHLNSLKHLIVGM